MNPRVYACAALALSRSLYDLYLFVYLEHSAELGRRRESRPHQTQQLFVLGRRHPPGWEASRHARLLLELPRFTRCFYVTMCSVRRLCIH